MWHKYQYAGDWVSYCRLGICTRFFQFSRVLHFLAELQHYCDTDMIELLTQIRWWGGRDRNDRKYAAHSRILWSLYSPWENYQDKSSKFPYFHSFFNWHEKDITWFYCEIFIRCAVLPWGEWSWFCEKISFWRIFT